MALEIDGMNEFGARALKHLAEDQIVWLTTSDAHGGPQPKPVWFLWEDGGTDLVYTGAETATVRHIGRNPRVALNFNTDPPGYDVVILIGTAEVVRDTPRADSIPAYIDKYANAMAVIGLTPLSFSDPYDVAIRVTPEKIRGFPAD